MKAHGETLGAETALQVYSNAIDNRIRNEQALMTMREAWRGTGLAIIDGDEPKETRMNNLRAFISKQETPIPLNLEELFGDADYCECEDCTSVYSPASYFVELLQYLRNNNLGSDPASDDPDPANNQNIRPGIENTPLEKLFRRRPDLGCLELTCDNTFTVLPYIDLVNEVMESFVVHLDEYRETKVPKQAKLEVFNIEDETTSELLAQPQHINYQAYCILKNAVYPFTLPYHQPIDSIRIFLKYLETSRHELLDVYRAADDNCASASLSAERQAELKQLHHQAIDRAVDAEFLGMTQEEYIILTKEAYWEKRYFDITLKKTHTQTEYEHNIGVKPVYEYYGYDGKTAELDMLDLDETNKLGLTFVKKQFLPRTGIDYVDLVELVKTQFINPYFPKGRALTILESIRFSYRFLQTLVDPDKTKSPQVRFAKLIEFLETWQPLVPLIHEMLHPDPCQQQKTNWCLEVQDLRRWVYCYFEKIGELIVLESGEGPQLPIEGKLFKPQPQAPDPINLQPANELFVGTLRKDGTILDETDNPIGKIAATLSVDSNQRPILIAGPVNLTNGKKFEEQFGTEPLEIKNNANDKEPIAYLAARGLILFRQEMPTQWLPTPDTCNLDKVRLTHLNGTPLSSDEYDRFQRFIRLWRKLGWTIDEVDKAIVGLSTQPTGTNGGNPTQPSDPDCIGFDDFIEVDCKDIGKPNDDDCGCDDEPPTDDWKCPEFPQVTYEITPYLLHQLVAVHKLLDRTGLPLLKLLTFWAEISTVAKKSLYSQLFLTHNLSGIDRVFKADADGNYLTQSAKISEHLPILMTALRLKADDITVLVNFAKLPDLLDLNNLSILYRHSSLAKILGIKISELPHALALFGNPFKSAWDALTLLETWGKMEDAGFSFRQLNYIIQNNDDKLRPIAPSKRSILQVTKTLYDGLTAIDRDHKDIPNDEPEAATTELVRTKIGLLFESTVVEQIIGLLEGTTVYTTNAPLNLTIAIPADQKTLAKKLKYSYQKDATPPKAGLQVTGILTAEEKAQAKARSTDPEWAKAIDRVSKQPQNTFDNALLGVFSTEKSRDEAKTELLAGDVLPVEGSTVNTPLDKLFYFLHKFLPFLRQQLAHRLIVDTIAGMTGLPNQVTDALISDLLKIGATKQSAIAILEGVKAQAVASTGVWKGFLIPPTDEAFTFIATSETKPQNLILDGEAIEFKYQQEDPSNVWSTDPTSKLKAGKLYEFAVIGQSADLLEWKTATVAKSRIPTSALLPDYTPTDSIEAEVFTKLTKSALLINGFNLSVDEVTYWQHNAKDFDAFDLNAINLKHWLRLQAYTTLRNSLPQAETTLLELFEWAAKSIDPANESAKLDNLSQKIAEVTNWNQDNIDKLIEPKHFNLKHLSAFRNEVNLVKLQKALIVADKIAVDIDRLFKWAKPSSKFSDCLEIAESIRTAVRARFNQEDWEQVVKPLNDELREHQKLALIAHLVVQKDLREWGVIDANSLFEFFLIDVQMDACMETSRIKQAISSVQLFVQRCFLGLEEKNGVKNEALSRSRWEWMQRYRVWEANRKVFLYPENWIEPQLRDDKSPFYKELESELLQRDINPQTVQDAMRTYIFKVDEVANLKVVGLFVEQEIDKDGKPVLDNNNPVYIKLHIFARTRNAPYFFYYRYFDITEKNWYPWEKVQVDIPSYDVENKENGTIEKNGAYLIPVVWNKRLLIFFPQFMKKTSPTPPKNNETFEDIGKTKPSDNKPTEYWEIKMAWSELRNGKWTQKQLSAQAVYDIPSTANSLPNISLYEFIPRIITTDPKVVIDTYQGNPAIGSFHFAGSQISVESKSIPSKPAIEGDFHYKLGTSQISSLQGTETNILALFGKEPYFNDQETSIKVNLEINKEWNFYHPFAHELLGKLTAGNLDDFFKYYLNYYLENVNSLDLKKSTNVQEAYGENGTLNGKPLYNELKRAYSIYNWEATFHAPMLLVDRLLKSQQFEQALKVCHYVFDPLAKGSGKERFWQFPPFKVVDAENVLEKLFVGLNPNQPDNTPGEQINEWRDKPFQPHVVARSRPVAYMKWVVMKYIEILIAWGDYLFRQDTIETLNQATQLYVLASNIYGPKGQLIPKRGKTQPQTYNSLLNKWDAFGNAMVELELAFPFSNQTPFPIGVSNGVVGLANVFGFATSLYFCIPDNPKLRGLRDTIDDRLFKLRNCQNIEGIFRKLPLFEPPIDPALLVQAAAQGLSLSSVLNDLNTPMPNYRFYYLLQKALELCSELKSMGNAFLSAKEKGDAEQLSLLRAKHESTMQNLVMEIKKQQLEEAGKSVEALQQNRKSPVYRLGGNRRFVRRSAASKIL